MAEAKLIIKAVEEVSKVFGNIKKVGLEVANALKGGFSQLRDIGLGLSGVGTGAAASFGVALKLAGDADKALRDTLTMTDKSGKAFDSLYKNLDTYADKLSSDFKVSGDVINSAFYMVLSSGAKPASKEFKELTETGLKLAKVAKLDLSDAIEGTSDTLNTFGLKLTEAGRMADVFFKASQLGSTTVPQLMEAMKQAAPVAKSMGMSLEETTAILTLFASKGIKGAEAGTTFRGIMSKLASPTKEASTALDLLGVKVFDSTGKMRPITTVLKEMQEGLKKLPPEQQAVALKAIAGEERFAAFASIMQTNLDIIPQFTKELQNSSGAIDQAAKTIDAGFNETLKGIIINFQLILKNVGNVIKNAIQPFAAELQNVTAQVIEWVKQNPKIIEIGTVIAVVAAAFITIAGVIATATATVGLFVIGITAAGTELAVASGIMALISPIVMAIVAALAALAVKIPEIVAYFKDEFTKIQEVVKVVWDNIVAFSEPVITTMKEISQKIISAVMEAWNTLYPQLKPVLMEFFNLVQTVFTDIRDRLLPVWTKFWEMVKPILEKFIDYLKSNFIKEATKLINQLKDDVEKMAIAWKVFTTIYDVYLKPFLAGVGKVFFAVGGWGKWLYDELKKHVDNIKWMWADLVKFLKIEWNKLKTDLNNNLGEITGTFGGLFNGKMSLSMNTSSLSSTRSSNKGVNLSPMSVGSSQPTSKPVVLNINFNGTNITDESSTRKFAQTIQKYITEINNRVIA